MTLCSLHLSAKSSDSIVISPDLIRMTWHSSKEKIDRRVAIYIPKALRDTTVKVNPSMLCSTLQSVPSLYLIHGINGCEYSWHELGHAIDTLEALVSTGQCRPVVLVMPDCNKWPFKDSERKGGRGNLWRCVLRYGKLTHEHTVEYAVSELIDMLDTTCHVSAEYAIAGLSDGARMAANVANVRPDRVRSVGLFSPVLHKDQLPKDSTQNYYIYVGKSDMFYASGNRFHKNMNRANRPHEFIEKPKGGHNWRMWQYCLSDLLRRLYPLEPQQTDTTAKNNQ